MTSPCPVVRTLTAAIDCAKHVTQYTTSPCPVVRTLTAAIDCAKQTHNVTGVTSQLRPSPGLRLVATVTNVPGLISGCHASSPLQLFPPFTFYILLLLTAVLLLSAYLHLQRRHSWFPKMKRRDMSRVLPWPVYSSSPLPCFVPLFTSS